MRGMQTIHTFRCRMGPKLTIVKSKPVHSHLGNSREEKKPVIFTLVNFVWSYTSGPPSYVKGTLQ